MPHFANTGIDWMDADGEGHRAEVGDVVDGLPESALGWLTDQGHIEDVAVREQRLAEEAAERARSEAAANPEPEPEPEPAPVIQDPIPAAPVALFSDPAAAASSTEAGER